MLNNDTQTRLHCFSINVFHLNGFAAVFSWQWMFGSVRELCAPIKFHWINHTELDILYMHACTVCAVDYLFRKKNKFNSHFSIRYDETKLFLKLLANSKIWRQSWRLLFFWIEHTENRNDEFLMKYGKFVEFKRKPMQFYHIFIR